MNNLRSEIQKPNEWRNSRSELGARGISSAGVPARPSTWRTLVVCSFAQAFLLGAGTVVAGTAFHDDFNGALAPAWTILRPDPAFYSLQATGLVLRCIRGDLYETHTDWGNIFLVPNPTAGDFTLTTKVRWLVPPSANWAQFDLLAYDDENNHVRLHEGWLDGSRRIYHAGEAGGHYLVQGQADVNFGTNWFWLQMRKRGTLYSGWYSTNGVNFSQIGALFAYGDGTPANLGLTAMVDPNQSATVVIDHFTVEDTPVPASNYTLDWWTVDGGGTDTLSTGQFTLAGTVGQPDASTVQTAGSFSLSGGFWSMLATAPPTPPMITSVLTATGRVNRPFNYTITATGNPSGYGASGLPVGSSVNATSGLISVMPSVAGVFNVLLSATNSDGVGSANLALTITENANTLFYDDFNGALSNGWSIVRPNPSYYSLQPTGLVLRCSRGDLWGSYNNALNLFLINNPAEDFTMTVRLRWPVPPSGNWEQFDLLAYDNDDNHVRLYYIVNNGSLAIGRVAEVNSTVTQVGGVEVNFGTNWLWLQMRKQASTYSGWYSTNGVDFLQATAPFTYGDGRPARLGFAAMSGVNGPENARALIDSFEVQGTPLPLPPGLVASYNANGTAADSSGGADGRFAGSYVPGVEGQAFHVNSLSNNFAAPAYNLPGGSAPRTLSCWINIRSNPGPHSDSMAGEWVGYGGPGVNQQFAIGYFNDAEYGWQPNQITFTQNGWGFGGPILNLNTWYYVAVTYDGSTLKMYINGAFYSSANYTLATMPYGSLWCSYKNPDFYADNIRVYSIALTPAQVLADYQNLSVPDSGPFPVVQWPVQQGGNGHWYQVVTPGPSVNWTTAQSDALSRGGYLACITSVAENTLIFGMVNKPKFWSARAWGQMGPWLGGIYSQGSWQWVSGEPWGYASWFPGQPDHNGGPVIWDDRTAFATTGNANPPYQPTWGDNWHTDTSPAWVVEYDGIPLRLTGISIDATGHLALRWHSPVAGLNYTVESTASLTNGAWSVVEPANQWPITAETWTNSAVETLSRGFFRVRASWSR